MKTYNIFYQLIFLTQIKINDDEEEWICNANYALYDTYFEI